MPVLVGLLVLRNRTADLGSLAACLVGLLGALEASLVQLGLIQPGLSCHHGVSGLALLVEEGAERGRDFENGLWGRAEERLGGSLVFCFRNGHYGEQLVLAGGVGTKQIGF